jgi:tetratricopeptide (TPR) repeat protein
MTPPKTDAEMAVDLARLAQLFLSYGKHAAADKLLNAAIELDANNPAVTRVRAFTAYKCGRYAEAVALARQARAAGASDTVERTTATPTAAGLAAMGLSLVEAFSLMSLGRTNEAGQRYASLDVSSDAASDDPSTQSTRRPVGRMNSE